MRALTLKNRPRHPRLQGMDLRRVGRITRNTPTPFMLLRTSVILENIKRLKRALPGIDLYYAVKANNHPAILRTLKHENCYFDISSVRELNDVLSIGVGPDKMIHTNPIKIPHEFESSVKLGVDTFVADNVIELEKFSRLAPRPGVLLRFKTAPSGSVVNLSYKFGADPSDIPSLLRKIIELDIPFRGFCFHVGSQCTDPSAYDTAIGAAAELIRIAREMGLEVPILDIGGGFPIEYTDEIPQIELFGQKIMDAIKVNIDPGIRVICEPGRYISGNAAVLFSSVIGKAIRDGQKWYYIDDGLYGSFSGRLFDHCFYNILTKRNTTWERAVLAGPTCDSFDVIYDECQIPPLEIGDILMFPSMGAYCSVSASTFNGLDPARIVEVDW